VGLGEPAPVEPEPVPEPAPSEPLWTPAQSILQGFAGRRHWDGRPEACDWYAAPKGTWSGWPLAGNVSRMAIRGPMGTPMIIALHVAAASEGPWAGWVTALGHVLDTVQTGYRERHEPFFQVGDSAIEMLPGDPAHIHLYFDAPGGMQAAGGFGDVVAIDVLYNLGFRLELVDAVPSPNDYLAGRAVAGRFV
jgi:hypothetical protein